MTRPTAETTAARQSVEYESLTLTNGGVWYDAGNITVPSSDHEVYFVQISIIGDNSSRWYALYARIKHGSDYYPDENGILFHLHGDSTDQHGECMLTIPRNMSGETITVQLKANFNNCSIKSRYYTSWGHTPHYHR